MGLLDTLSYVGDSLDKATGSRALRGLLGGKPRELLSVVPFSDRFGLTDPAEIRTGRDLTDRYGLTSATDRGFGSGMAGFAADVALDPSNLVGGLGLRKLAKLNLADDAVGAGRAARSGADFNLGLKYDAPGATPAAFGLDRADPEWVNNRTFYHGTSVPDLRAADLDPMKTDSEALYGRGIYTSDEAFDRANLPITSGYANARSGLTPMYLERLLSGGDQSLGHAGKNWRNLASEGLIAPNLVREIGDDKLGDLARKLVGSVPNPKSHAAGQILRRLAGLRGVPFPDRPRIYQSQSDFGRILDLDRPIPDDEIFTLSRMLESPVRRGLAPGQPNVSRERLERVLRGDGGARPASQSLREMMENLDEWSDDMWVEDHPDALTSALKSLDYDALTHTGGLNTGNPYHQVVIGLDPNDKFGVGRATPYPRWETYRHLMPDLYSDFSLGPPRHPASPTANMMFSPFPGGEESLNRAAAALGPRYGGGVDQLLDLFDRTAMRPGYGQEHLDRLRELDPETLARLASEIPEGSEPLASGFESVVLAAPDKRVIRIGNDRLMNANVGIPPGRPNEPWMLQPLRSVNVGPYQVEHLNRVTPLDEADRLTPSLEHGGLLTPEVRADIARARNVSGQIESQVQGAVAGSGYNPFDVYLRNIGVTPEGLGLAIDPGAARPSVGWGSPNYQHIYRPPSLVMPSPAQVAELERLGAPSAVRDALSRGVEEGVSGQGLPVSGLGPEYLELVRRLATDPGLSEAARAARLAANTAPVDFGALAQALGRGTSEFSLGSPAATAPPLPGSSSAPAGLRELLSGTTMRRNVPVAPESLGAPAGAGGWYNPSSNTIVQLAGAANPGGVRRHEMAHAMVANANRAGSSAGLPLALRPSAALRRSGHVPAGRYLEELAAAGLSQRGLGNQLGAAFSTAVNPGLMSSYADVIGADPLLRQVMMAPPALWGNRVPTGLGVLGANEISRLQQLLSERE